MFVETQNLIDQLWDFNDPAASESRFREALANTTDPLQLHELQSQIARAQGLQRNFDAAHRTLDEIQSSIAPHGNAGASQSNPHTSSDVARVRCLLERGRLFNSSKQHDKALPLFEHAHRLAHAIHDDHLAVDSAHMVAITHSNLGHADLALKWNRSALAFAEKSTQPRARQWRGSLHNNIGWTLHDQGDFARALTHFDRALEARRDEGKPDGIRIARWCVARCLRSLNRIEEALAIQQSLLSESEALHEKPDGFNHEELGECLLALGRSAEARQHFAMAHRLLSQDSWLVAEQSSRLDRLAQLAAVHDDDR